jgi:beta-glucanase (GH16 family)
LNRYYTTWPTPPLSGNQVKVPAMNRLKSIFSVLMIHFAFLLVFPKALSAQPSYDTYQLVWSDEFDEDGLPDPSNWGYEQGCSVRNDELQYYARAREENSRVENGFLIIEARRGQMEGCGYTSASLITSGKRAFQYGIFEIRAKIDVRRGSWPAFWTLGVSEEWPSNGEVDIMEYYNGSLHANVAWGTDTRWQAKWDSQSKSVGSEFSDDFHIWRMHWTEDFIDLWVDDFKQNSTDLSTTVNGSLSSLRNPFHQKAYIVVNQAIGSNGGDPSGTEFPIQYIVDYVRVYQEGADTTSPKVTAVSASANGKITILFSEGVDKNSSENIANYSFNGPSITLSDADLQNNGKTVALWATGLSVDEQIEITIRNIRDDAIPANTMNDTELTCTVLPESEKLTGTVIGNGDPWDGISGIEYDKALDGNTSTYADCVNDPVWVGYDFGSEHSAVITEIRYYPRDEYADRMTGTFFEISDDGQTWTKLYTISATPPQGTFTTAAITDAPSSRFIRYNGTGGYLNVGEIEFYGFFNSSSRIRFPGQKLSSSENFKNLDSPLQIFLYSLDGKQLLSYRLQKNDTSMGAVLNHIRNTTSTALPSGIVMVSVRNDHTRFFDCSTIIGR